MHIQGGVAQFQTGHLINLSAEAFRVKLGIYFYLQETPYNIGGMAFYVSDCWYKSLWHFC